MAPQSPKKSGLHIIIGVGKPDSPKSSPPDFPFSSAPGGDEESSAHEAKESPQDEAGETCTCPDPEPVCARCGKPIEDGMEEQHTQGADSQGPIPLPSHGGYGE